MSKQIHITFDYELFFGSSPGSIAKCMLEPTQQLIELAAKHNALFVFFVDAGFLWQLKNYANHPGCKKEFDLISEQLKMLCNAGHEIGLHVHPHWEDSVFESDSWKINVKRYKLSDFSEEEVQKIISKYHQTLIDITGKRCLSFRAGGWCIQPFEKIRPALVLNNIMVDSSVYKNGYQFFTAQSYDFRNAPDKAKWKFENNECVEDNKGGFTEIAISPDRISPFFYMDLYLRMKLDPIKYKPIGDGAWLKNKKRIYKQFYSYTDHFACCDGFFASRLRHILIRNEKSNKDRMLVLGHPKSMAKCSFEYLDRFLEFSIKRGYKITTLT
ncbi:MAG: polysaccharide deacetylase family protein [Bacteroidia bacterium]